MVKRSVSTFLPTLGSIDRAAGQLAQQLTQRLRDAIANGDVKVGERLPSTRSLAVSLGVARGTVTEAFDQLQAEGYLEAKAGAGTRVAASLQAPFASSAPDLAFTAKSTEMPLPPRVARLASIARALAPLPDVPFAITVPAGIVAPDDTWRRLGNKIRASRHAAPASYGDPKGLRELRSTIAIYVRQARAVRCEPENVIITAGIQQGLYLSTRVILSSGDSVWAEDPAYPGMTALFEDLDIKAIRIPVDTQGLDIEAAAKSPIDARAAFVTPSHHYPLGMPLSMARRLALLTWARHHNAWIVENDYDSELRYAGHPFPSLQGLDPSRVIYLGTLSKVLFPSLRLGYVVAPDSLVDAFAGARAILDRHSPTADQHVLAAFMRDGHFDAHIRRIRGVYAERRIALIAAIKRELADWARLQPSDQGMHVVVWLAPGLNDIGIAKKARADGLSVTPISPMYAAAPRNGLMLGFGGFPAGQLEAAVSRLRSVFEA